MQIASGVFNSIFSIIIAAVEFCTSARKVNHTDAARCEKIIFSHRAGATRTNEIDR